MVCAICRADYGAVMTHGVNLAGVSCILVAAGRLFVLKPGITLLYFESTVKHRAERKGFVLFFCGRIRKLFSEFFGVYSTALVKCLRYIQQ